MGVCISMIDLNKEEKESLLFILSEFITSHTPHKAIYFREIQVASKLRKELKG